MREPLVHFVLFGALVLCVDMARGPSAPATDSPPTSTTAPSGDGALAATPSAPVVVDDALIADLTRQLHDRLERPPTEAELNKAVEAWISEELLVREARRLGVQRGDPIVRRRLAEKMAWLLGARDAAKDPTDAQLRALFERYRDAYRVTTQITLRQLFVRGRGEQSRVKAAGFIERLKAGAAPQSLAGDPPPGGPVLRGRELQRLSARYGAAFISELDTIPVNRWSLRPSNEGWHALVVLERRDGRALSFEEARVRLKSRWRASRRGQAKRDAVKTLRARAAVRGWPR